MRVRAMEQDGEQQSVLNLANVPQGCPVLPAQLHGGKEAQAPGGRQHGAVVHSLEDRRVPVWGDGEIFADRVEARGNRLDRGQCRACGGGDAPAFAQQVDEPFVGRDGTWADDDRGQIAVEHRHAIHPGRWLESPQPYLQRLQAQHFLG